MKNHRVIFHIDMNSFYASVEMARDPKLKGKAIAIAGNPEQRKGIIVTSSYEARAKGVKTTMPLWEAKKLCPELIVLRPDFPSYREMSSRIFKLLYDITEWIEPVSIDEGYLDVTPLPIHPLTLAEDIQTNILKQLDIPCSIGIGPNKFLAKTASDMKKPLGITVLRKRDIQSKLWPLPVSDMYGIGQKTAEKLNRIEIQTIEELATADTYALNQLLGINGERLQNRANGMDTRAVDPDALNEFKSIGNSETLPDDTTDETRLKQLLLKLTERVDGRLKRREVTGKSIQLTIRYKDRQTVTRSRTVSAFVDGVEDIYQVILELFAEHWTNQPVRLLGVTVSSLLERSSVLEQLSLFTYESQIKKAKAQETMKHLEEKYGSEAFPDLKENEKQDQADEKLLLTSFQKDFLDDFKKD